MKFLLATVFCLLVATAAAASSVTFVSPQERAQAIGVLPIEVITNAAAVDRVEFYAAGNRSRGI